MLLRIQGPRSHHCDDEEGDTSGAHTRPHRRRGGRGRRPGRAGSAPPATGGPSRWTSCATPRDGTRTTSRSSERERSLRYGDLDAAVDGGVAALGSEGVAAGDALLLLVGNDVTSVVAIHAALRTGALVMVAPTSAGTRRCATS